MQDNESIIENDLDDTEDYTPSIHNTENYFKKKIQDSNLLKTQTPNETRLNNIKTEKYFSNINDEAIKIALKNYEKKICLKIKNIKIL